MSAVDSKGMLDSGRICSIDVPGKPLAPRSISIGNGRAACLSVDVPYGLLMRPQGLVDGHLAEFSMRH